MSSPIIGAGGNTPAPFKSQTVDPASHFSVGNVPAPTALYVGTDSFLRLQVQNISAATSVTVHTRLLRSGDGVITESEDVKQITQGGGVQTFFINLTEGFLLSAIVSTDSNQIPRGLLFCALELCHGGPTNVHRDALLVQDYVAQTYSVGWPGGTLRLSTEGPGSIVYQVIGSPGAGNDMAVGYQANARARLMTLCMTFTTSAVVGNRFPRIQIAGGGNLIFTAPVAAAIPASTVAIISIYPGAGQPSVTNNVHLIPVPQTLMLNASSVISTNTPGKDAGDLYNNIFATSEEWVDA